MVAVDVGGRHLEVTNLDKVLYPETGTTKAEVIDYYSKVAGHILPLLEDRPVTRIRWPDGVGGESFFEKSAPGGMPDWIPTVTFGQSRPIEYPLVSELASLIWLGQFAALELHVPQWRWDFEQNQPGNPDRLVIDLDPGPGAGLDECGQVALAARAILVSDGLEPWPVTSGSKGLQLYADLEPATSSDGISEYAKEIAQALTADMPELVVWKMTKSLRTGKVLVDYSQNNGKKTTICPYSMRGRERPTVAMPRDWSEVESGGLEQVTIHEALHRLGLE